MIFNGLLCSSDDEQLLTLWNPSIRSSLLLPKSDVESMTNERYAFGIFVDHITNDYKILRIVDFKLVGAKIEIFRLSTGSWEVLNCQTPFEFLDHRQLDLKGVSYWVGVNFNANLILVSFNGHEELFGSAKIHVPDVIDNRYSIECLLRLFLFNESLVFIHSIDIEDDDSSVA
ncbi:hypothetical protein LIER_21884 [Lithospermum erythrorhizon]|uniref:F-box associated beta-propeller type 1 domain-containing protein n=1 Tax=Lithospermum erythrorhizon TaxID=34254 RepID=A0AAV3QS05_LITER